MPRKKKTKVTRKSKTVRQYRSARAKQRFGGIKWLESYSSFLLGVVVVIVAVLFAVSIIRQQNHSHIQQTSSLSTGPTRSTSSGQATPTPGSTIVQNNQTYYIVKPNDSLWNIAQSVYGNGYKWIDIAKANYVANPDTIFSGDKLLLPNAPSSSQLGQLLNPSPTPMPNAIVGKTYTVQAGDSLWSIALRAYADGYQWVKIAKVNNLANPDLIFSGNVLTLPR